MENKKISIEKKKIIHIITGLRAGGAEFMLLRLVKSLNKDCQNIVVTLSDCGVVGQELEAEGIQLYSLRLNKSILSLFRMRRLVRFIKSNKPDLVQTWMYHADLIGGVAARLAGIKNIVWGIRQSNLSKTLNKRSTLIVAKLCAVFSARIPTKIVCCSLSAKESHIDYGYNAKKMVIIENGFDTNKFYPNEKTRKIIRDELHIRKNEKLIGMVARFDPQKNQKDFVMAASKIKKRYPECRFVMCGEGADKSNKQLFDLLKSLALDSELALLGKRLDIPAIMSGLDILISPSLGEGFPNVIGEAMSSEVVCVVTNVGASSSLLGECGILLPGISADEIVEGVGKFMSFTNKERKSIGKKARLRIINNYSIESAARQYSDLYRVVYE